MRLLAETKESKDLVELAKNRNLILFVGSAISRFSPSELPTGAELRNITLGALAKRAPELESHAKAIKNENLNPELIYQIIYDNAGDHFFDSHEILETGKINENHLFLARAAKAGYIGTILTTNFDHLIEDALEQEGLEKGKDFFVYYSEEGFKRYLTQRQKRAIAITKLHGTIQDKDSMIATLNQTGKGLSPNQAQILDDLLKDKYMLFVGYSGNDLDNYPKILSMADTAKGIYWNFRSEELPESIQRLFNAYQNKAVSIVMDLTDLFKQLAKGLDIDYHKPSNPSKEVQQRLTQYVNEWANQIPEGLIFSIIGQILHRIKNLEDASQCYDQALKIYRKIDDREGKASVLGNIGLIYGQKGELKKALKYCQNALKICGKIPDRKREARALLFMGTVYDGLKTNHEKALRYYKHALKIFQEINDREGEASVLNHIGLFYHAEGDLKKTLIYYGNALKICRETGDPQQEAGLLIAIGLTHRERRDLKNALKCYQHALGIVTMIGIKHQIDFVTEHIEQAYVLQSYEVFEEIKLELTPPELEAWELVNKGNSLAASGRYEEALPCYDKALELEPGLAKAWTGKTASLNGLRRYEEALSCADRATKLDPGLTEAWVNKGNSLAALGRRKKALSCYDRALKIDPQYAHAWINKGASLVKLDRYEEALECCERAIELDPRNTEAWQNKGVSLASLRRFEEALACFEEVLKIDPGNELAREGRRRCLKDLARELVNKGVSLANLGRHEEAIDCYDRALEVGPRYAEAWVNKGVSLGELGRHEEALSCADRAIEVDAGDADAWTLKGISLASLRRFEEALACFEKALEIDPGHGTAQEGRQLCLETLRRGGR